MTPARSPAIIGAVKTSTFGLVLAERPLLFEGEKPSGRAKTTVLGNIQTPVAYWDFVIDGVSLYEQLSTIENVYLDNVTSIQDEWPHDSVAAIERLLGAPGDLPDGRTSIRVCPCADLNCGAVTARIEVADGIVYWHDLGDQWAYQDGVDPIPSTGPRLSYAFLAEEYESVLLAELERQRALVVDLDIALAAQRRPSWLERLGILRKIRSSRGGNGSF